MSKRFGTQELIDCYRRGVFPMSEGRHDPDIYFVEPDIRGVLFLDALHIPKRLAQLLRQDKYDITVNEAFPTVIEKCAAKTGRRRETWINSTIINLYCTLHRDGFAHSVEVWDGNDIVGGIYGVAVGSVFFGESMFSTAPNTSKVALMHLAARLLQGGYHILDAQLYNPHLKQFGLTLVPCEKFRQILAEALKYKRSFGENTPLSGAEVVKIIESAKY